MIDLTKQYQTRDERRKTTQLIHCPANEKHERVVAFFNNGSSEVYFEDGMYRSGGEYTLDLIPIPEEITLWVSYNNRRDVHCAFINAEKAQEYLRDGFKIYPATITIDPEQE